MLDRIVHEVLKQSFEFPSSQMRSPSPTPFSSSYPSYYHDGSFGIRIESLILVVKAQTEHNFKNKGFLTFEPITLVPLCQVGIYT